jgi:cysteine desulfurase
VRRVAGILNVTVDGVEGETLLLALADLAVSSGSACASLHAEPSYVLRALGRSDRLAQSSLRLSLGRFTTLAEVERAAARIREEVVRLRAGEPRAGALPGSGDDTRYNAEVRRRLHALPGWGDLAAVGSVVRGRAGDREQGTAVEFVFQVERDRVAVARFQGFGCPHLLAAASWTTEAVQGLDREALAAWNWQDAARALAVPAAKFGRLLTLQDAIRDVVRNWPGGTESTV